MGTVPEHSFQASSGSRARVSSLDAEVGLQHNPSPINKNARVAICGAGDASSSPHLGLSSTAAFGNGGQSTSVLPPITISACSAGDTCNGQEQFTFHPSESVSGGDACDESDSANLQACHSASALLEVMRGAASPPPDDQPSTAFA